MGTRSIKKKISSFYNNTASLSPHKNTRSTSTLYTHDYTWLIKRLSLHIVSVVIYKRMNQSSNYRVILYDHLGIWVWLPVPTTCVVSAAGLFLGRFERVFSFSHIHNRRMHGPYIYKTKLCLNE